jgi:hypothetical protein
VPISPLGREGFGDQDADTGFEHSRDNSRKYKWIWFKNQKLIYVFTYQDVIQIVQLLDMCPFRSSIENVSDFMMLMQVLNILGIILVNISKFSLINKKLIYVFTY